MNVDLQMLERITETAIKAAGIRDYDVSPLRKMLVNSDGTEHVVEMEPPPVRNEVYDFDTVMRIAKQCVSGCTEEEVEVYVGQDEVTVLHDVTRTMGATRCPLTKSQAVQAIEKYQCEAMSPEGFERIASLIFEADALFVDTLRKLQWHKKGEATMRVANVSKSADMYEIAKVTDENGMLFQDISLFVKTHFFVLPMETKSVEIELRLSANAETKTIAFAPVPNSLERARLAAMQEVQSVLMTMLDAVPVMVLLGKPILKERK